MLSLSFLVGSTIVALKTFSTKHWCSSFCSLVKSRCYLLVENLVQRLQYIQVSPIYVFLSLQVIYADFVSSRQFLRFTFGCSALGLERFNWTDYTSFIFFAILFPKPLPLYLELSQILQILRFVQGFLQGSLNLFLACGLIQLQKLWSPDLNFYNTFSLGKMLLFRIFVYFHIFSPEREPERNEFVAIP